MTLLPPALPADWPFQPRPLAGLTRLGPTVLPGFGSGWRVETLPEGLWDEPPAPLGGAFGRGGVVRCGDRVVRPYRRGGLLRHLVRRTYPGPGRFQRELAVHRALWGAGFPTVEPLGCAWRRCGIGVEGLYLTRWAAVTPWPRCWEVPEGVDRLLQAIRALAAWGVWSPDLNATNVMVDEEGRICLLDWDRAAWSCRADLVLRYQARLLRSLERLKAPEAIRRAVEAWG